jgi:hypothetical protein
MSTPEARTQGRIIAMDLPRPADGGRSPGMTRDTVTFRKR